MKKRSENFALSISFCQIMVVARRMKLLAHLATGPRSASRSPHHPSHPSWRRQECAVPCSLLLLLLLSDCQPIPDGGWLSWLPLWQPSTSTLTSTLRLTCMSIPASRMVRPLAAARYKLQLHSTAQHCTAHTAIRQAPPTAVSRHISAIDHSLPR